MAKKFYEFIQSIRESSPDGASHNKEKVITIRHKDSGKELRVVDTAIEKYKRMGYEHVKEEVKEPTGKLKDACWKGYTAIGMKEKNGRKVPNCVPVDEQFASDKPEKDREAVDGRFTSASAKSVKKSAPQATPKNEDVEHIEEMPGANMDTRAIHKHLRKSGWLLSRTKGSHDVYTHPKSEKHIAVPRHKQLKAPLVRGIMKDAQVSEEVQHIEEISQQTKSSMANESRGHKILTTKLKQIGARKQREQKAEKQHPDPKEIATAQMKKTSSYYGEGVAEADKLQGTPVVSLRDFGDKDYTKDKYGRTVPKKLKKDDPRVKFYKEPKKQGVAESLNESAIFLNPNTVIVGQDHRKPLDLSPETLKRIQEIAKKHGAWYEGDGGDTKYTKDVIDNYVGSFDDEIAKTINPNDPKWLFVLFSNVDENNTVQRVGVDPNDTIFNRLLATDKVNSYQNIGFTEQALKKFLSMCSEDDYDFVKMSQQPATQKNVTKFLKAGENLMWPSNWEQYPNRAGKVAKSVDERDQYLAKRKSGVYVVGSGHIKAIQQILGKQDVVESSDNSGNSKGSWKVETPWRKMESPVVVDKSGAKHTPMSRVKHLAKMAARKKVTEQNDDIQTPAKKSLAFKGVVKNTEKPTKGKKIDSDEKFEAEPELNTQIMRNM